MNMIFSWCSSLDCLYRLQAILQILIVIAGLVGAAAGYAVYKIRGQITALQETKARVELQATQSQLNLANDALAKLKTAQAPRQITEEQGIRLQQKLKSLTAPTGIVVTYDGTNHETRDYARRFSDIFTAIGWQNSNLIVESIDAHRNQGTSLVIRMDGWRRLTPLGDAIIAVFESEGVEIHRLGHWDAYRRDASTEIEIRVGQKPLKPL